MTTATVTRVMHYCCDELLNVFLRIFKHLRRICAIMLILCQGARRVLMPCIRCIGSAMMVLWKMRIGGLFFLLMAVQVACVWFTRRQAHVMRNVIVSITDVDDEFNLEMVRTDGLWGPVIVIVPEGSTEGVCTKVNNRDAVLNHTEGCPLDDPTYYTELSKAETNELFTNSTMTTTTTAIANKTLSQVAGIADIVRKALKIMLNQCSDRNHTDKITIVSGCGYELAFDRPRWWDRYLSMATIGGVLRSTCNKGFNLNLTGMIDKMRDDLMSGSWYTWIIMAVKYASRWKSLTENRWGIRPPGNLSFLSSHGARTRFDRQLEAVLIYFVSSVFLLLLQMTAFTSYMIMWRKGHYMVAYRPTGAIRLYYWTVMAMLLLNEIEKCYRCFAKKCNTFWLLWFWCCFGVWMVFLTIPMLGTACNYLQLIWQLHDCYALSEGSYFFKERLVGAGRNGEITFAVFLVAFCVEALLVVGLECCTGSAQTIVEVPVVSPPHRYRELEVMSTYDGPPPPHNGREVKPTPYATVR